MSRTGWLYLSFAAALAGASILVFFGVQHILSLPDLYREQMRQGQQALGRARTAEVRSQARRLADGVKEVLERGLPPDAMVQELQPLLPGLERAIQATPMGVRLPRAERVRLRGRLPETLPEVVTTHLREAAQLADREPAQAALAYRRIQDLVSYGGHSWVMIRFLEGVMLRRAEDPQGETLLRTLHGELLRAYPGLAPSYLLAYTTRIREQLGGEAMDDLLRQEAATREDARLVQALPWPLSADVTWHLLRQPEGVRLVMVGGTTTGDRAVLPLDMGRLAGALLGDAHSNVQLGVGPPPAPFNPIFQADLSPELPGLQLYLEPPNDGAAEELVLPSLAVMAVGLLVLVGGLVLALATMRRSLELARLKEQFVASVSHDLKTPLSLVRMFAETLEMNRADSEEQEREFLGVIRREAERLSGLVDNILDFSRLEAGRTPWRAEDTDLGAVVRETVEAERPGVERAGFTLHADLPAHPVRVTCDRQALASALRNLLANAMKYSPRGSQVTVSLGQAGATWQLVVADEGPGVPGDERERVFEKFYRGRAVRGGETGGAGVGLFLVRAAAQAHQGRAWLADRPGGGTLAVIELPVNGGRNDGEE